MEKNLLFFVNPKAGQLELRHHLIDMIDVFTAGGYAVTVHTTQNARDLTEQIVRRGSDFDLVVCAGGDGTLSETASGLVALDSPPLLGYIPVGSTNDCATTLELPKSPVKAAAIAAGQGIARPSDIGRLNGQPFIYVAAFGAFTQVAYETPQDLKNALGHLAYVLGGIASLPTITPYHLKVEYDGQVLEDDFYFGMVSNAYSIAGIRISSATKVELDDGLFEVDLIKKPVSLSDVANGFQTLVDQNKLSGGARVHFKASRLVITCDRPIPWTLDGEYGGNQLVNVVEAFPKALNIIRGK